MGNRDSRLGRQMWNSSDTLPMDVDNDSHNKTNKKMRLSSGENNADSWKDEGAKKEAIRRFEPFGFEEKWEAEEDNLEEEETFEKGDDFSWFSTKKPVPRVPDEVWNQILSFLTVQDRCITSMVCKDWRSRAWSTATALTFNFRQRQDQEAIMTTILSKCCNLKSLCFRDCFVVSGRIMTKLPSSLQKFEFFNCSNLTKTMNNKDLFNLPPTLTSFSLHNCENVDDESIQYLPRTIKELDLSGCNITDVGILTLPPQVTSLKFCGIPFKFPALHALPASIKMMDLSDTKVTDESLSLPEQLYSLDLSNCSQITDAGLQRLNKGLKILSLQQCSITDAAITYLPESLQELSLKDCLRITEKCLAHMPPVLRVLNLWGCNNVSKENLVLPYFLESVNLAAKPRSAYGLTDDGVRRMQFPRQLKSLCLFGCRITDVGLEYLPDTLEELDMSWNPITDKGLNFIAHRFPKLKKLIVANTSISREGIILLENNRPQLNVLKGPRFCD